MGRIRAVALAVMWREDALLAVEHVEGERRFFRPPGGTIEFGELAIDAVRREIQEELDVEISTFRQLAVLENIFSAGDESGHEVVFIFEAQWPGSDTDGETVEGCESDGTPFTCRWIPRSALGKLDRALYPDGLGQLLAAGPPAQ